MRVKALLQALGAAAFDVPNRIHEGDARLMIILIIAIAHYHLLIITAISP